MILAGKLKPNLGRFDNPPDWQEILVNFRGSELQNFFTKLLEDNIKAIIKPQYVDSIPRSVKGKVNEIIGRKDERDQKENLISILDLKNVLERDITQLSGGELQRFAIAVSCMQGRDTHTHTHTMQCRHSISAETIAHCSSCGSLALCVSTHWLCVCVCVLLSYRG